MIMRNENSDAYNQLEPRVRLDFMPSLLAAFLGTVLAALGIRWYWLHPHNLRMAGFDAGGSNTVSITLIVLGCGLFLYGAWRMWHMYGPSSFALLLVLPAIAAVWLGILYALRPVVVAGARVNDAVFACADLNSVPGPRPPRLAVNLFDR